jgi:hypothetical protein
MISWNYIIVIACLAAIGFLIRKESIRVNKLQLPWRIVASVIAVAGLACLILPITIKITDTSAMLSRQVILLTEGYHPDSIKKFLANNKKEISLYTADPDLLKTAVAYKPSLVVDPAMLADSLKAYEPLHVFGYGLTTPELKKLDGRIVIFHPSSLPIGISSINWERKIKRGEPLLIQGSFNNTGSAYIKLLLNGLHTNLDSIIIPAGKQQPFQLSAVPKNTGRNIFSLIALSGNDTMETEKIPFEIDSVKPLKILILASSPDFENKYLKNWLFKNGYQIASRTTISRNKYRKDYLNNKEIPLYHITNSLLDKFDVLISDADELASISAQGLVAIRSGVEQGGLGLIIKADSFSAPGAFYARHFPLYHRKGNTIKQALFHWQASGKRLPALSDNNPALIKKQPGTQPLLYNETSGIYVSSTLYGSGKLLVTTLNNTYSWALAGYDSAYHSLWSSIIQKAAPKSYQKQNWYTKPFLPRLNEPVEITLQSETLVLPKVSFLGTNIYFEQNNQLSEEWKGSYWPAETGWQAIQEQGGSYYWLYIYNNTEWKTLYGFENYRQTKNYVNVNDPVRNKTEVNVKREVRKPVSKMYFFLAALISCGYLWWEKKYNDV